MVDETAHREFVQSVIDNVKRNGFPDKKVAFPIESLYAAAEKAGANLNQALGSLDEIQIAHVKTPEKIIFYAKDRDPLYAAGSAGAPTGASPADMLGGLDPSMLEGMDPSQIMAAAAQMMQNMSPEQLEAAKQMYENMTDEERAQLLEQAKKMGF